MVSPEQARKLLHENNLPKGTYGLQLGEATPEGGIYWGGAQWDFYTTYDHAQALAHAWMAEAVTKQAKEAFSSAPYYRPVNFAHKDNHASILAQLAENYPEIPEATLQKIADVRDRFESLGEGITHTSSDIVLPVIIEGEQAFAKLHSTQILNPEAHALSLAQQYPELHPITPKLLAYIQNGTYGILLTQDTQEKEIIPRESITTYLSLMHKVFNEYTAFSGITQEELKKPVYTDVFNAVLLQAFLRPYAAEPLFSDASSRLVLPFEELESRVTTREDLTRLRKYKQVYHTCVSKLTGLELSPQTVIIDDLKPSNVFPGTFRPRGDFGEIKTGSPEFAFARMEQEDNAAYAGFIAFASNQVGYYLQDAYSHDKRFTNHQPDYSKKAVQKMAEAIKVISPLSSIRLLSFSLKQGDEESAGKYERAICRYHSQLRQFS
ncbi:MAG TPA: hypothetical protein VJH95_03605 [Candidatus Nanoarchaeia archaeon]|nr:hypothetical protein [Candidatus Nanoarchaeia archaeon]